jgi:hypothetical protein
MIKIIRDSAYVDFFRTYKVVLDDEFIGKIKNGKIARFDILPGKHELYLRLDWVRSNKVQFSTDGQDIEFECGTNLRGFKIIFAPLYWMLGPTECIYLRDLSNIHL